MDQPGRQAIYNGKVMTEINADNLQKAWAYQTSSWWFDGKEIKPADAIEYIKKLERRTVVLASVLADKLEKGELK